MKRYYSEDEVSQMLRKLNACYDLAFQWQYRRAQKDHTDLFNKKIHEGEHYFRLRMGGSYSNDLKLSYESMEILLFAIFVPLPNWEKRADQIINEKIQDARKIINNLRP